MPLPEYFDWDPAHDTTDVRSLEGHRVTWIGIDPEEETMTIVYREGPIEGGDITKVNQHQIEWGPTGCWRGDVQLSTRTFADIYADNTYNNNSASLNEVADMALREVATALGITGTVI